MVRRHGNDIALKSKQQVDLLKGDIVIYTLGGGGGYGNPGERDAQAITHDLEDGVISQGFAAAWGRG